jgi:hypothetical protein
MAKFLYQVLMKANRAIVQIAHYVVLNCDEVSTIDNESCSFVRDCYVM